MESPLEIKLKTGEQLALGRQLWLLFKSKDDTMLGQFIIRFKNEGQAFEFGGCNTDAIPFSESVDTSNPEDGEPHIVRIRFTRITAEEINLQLRWDGVKVGDFTMSDSTCTGGEKDWKTYWSKEIENIVFSGYLDHVSEYYRVGKSGDCTMQIHVETILNLEGGLYLLRPARCPVSYKV